MKIVSHPKSLAYSTCSWVQLNLFNLTELPETMLVIGAGPIGMELAQSFRRFGTKVFVFEMAAHFLPREDPDAAAAVQKSLERDGIRMFHAVKFVKVECSDDGNVHQAPFSKGFLSGARQNHPAVKHTPCDGPWSLSLSTATVTCVT